MNTFQAFAIVATCLLLSVAGCVNGAEESKTGSAASGGPSQFARLGTNRVYYTTDGHGPQTVVLIHGWSCNGTFWREQIPALKDKARVIVIDLPGHGQSDKPVTDYTMDFFAKAVLAVLSEAKVEKATLIGHSMGTPVMCRVYSQAPERVAGLMAVDGVMRRPKMSAAQGEQFIGPFRTPEYREQLTRFVNSMFPNPGTEALRDRVRAEMAATPQQVMCSAMEGMFGTNQPAWDLEKVNVPVMAINTKSPMWTPDYQAYVRSLSAKTDYRTIEEAGHFLMMEKPQEFNQMMLEMLEKFELVRK